MDKPYHHGDLKRALIEAGLELIRESGTDKLSLRKTAERCGVSSAAPYAHFAGKDDLISAIQSYVTELFVEELKKSIAGCPPERVLTKLGAAYVRFFHRNPLYFDLLFSRRSIRIRTALSDNGGCDPAFELFKNAAAPVLGSAGVPEETAQNKLMAMWGMVHGLAAISTTAGLDIDIDWENRTEDILGSVSL